MQSFIEGEWRVSFDQLWNVIKYDGDGGAYRTRICKIADTKAVDFVGVIMGNITRPSYCWKSATTRAIPFGSMRSS